MSKHGSSYGLFDRGGILLETIYEEDDKHALMKALCLAECDYSAVCEEGFMLCRVDCDRIPMRTVANVKNGTAL